MQIGIFPNPSLNSQLEQERFERFTSLLTEGQTVFQAVENVQIQRWEKVVWNVAWVSALWKRDFSGADDAEFNYYLDDARHSDMAEVIGKLHASNQEANG